LRLPFGISMVTSNSTSVTFRTRRTAAAVLEDLIRN
jgi:hypothetical protein